MSLEGMRLSILLSIWRWSDIPLRIESNPEEAKEWEYGNLPIHRACANEKTPINIIQSLINSYPQSIELKCETLGRLPLHYIIRWNSINIELLTWLLEKYPSGASCYDDTGHTALTYHLWFNNANTMDITKLLIQADDKCVSMVDKYGYTPLHHACKHLNLEICEHLIELYGNAVMMKTKSGLTPKQIVHTVDKEHPLFDVLCKVEEKRGGDEKKEEGSDCEIFNDTNIEMSIMDELKSEGRLKCKMNNFDNGDEKKDSKDEYKKESNAGDNEEVNKDSDNEDTKINFEVEE